MNIAMEHTEVSVGRRKQQQQQKAGPVLQQQLALPRSVPVVLAPLTTAPASLCPWLLQEYVNGQLKNKYGDVFIRGNNGERPAAGTPTALFCQQPARLASPTANWVK